jgi:hypothetical protein
MGERSRNRNGETAEAVAAPQRFEVRVDKDRLLEMVTLDEWDAISEIMSAPEEFKFTWIKVLRGFVAKMAWADGGYLQQETAYAQLGSANLRQLMAAASEIMKAGEEAAVPEASGPDSASPSAPQ